MSKKIPTIIVVAYPDRGAGNDPDTVNQQILVAIKFGVCQNKVIYVNLAAIKFGVSPWPVYAVYDRRICWQRQILPKTRNLPNSPNIIARQNLLIYSNALSEYFV